jgi:hypothetical protein
MCCKGVKACTTRKRKAAQLNFWKSQIF